MAFVCHIVSPRFRMDSPSGSGVLLYLNHNERTCLHMNYPTYMPAPYGNPQGYMPMQTYGPRPDMQGPHAQPVQPQQIPQAIQGLSAASRPVTSREEANSIPADFSGNLMIFPDISHNRVYLKRWNINAGAADFVEYAPIIQAAPEQEPESPQIAFASIQDVQNLQDVVEQLKKEVEKMKRPTTAVARPVKKDKGDSGSE